MTKKDSALEKLVTFLTHTKDPRNHQTIDVDGKARKILSYFLGSDVYHGELAPDDDIYRTISKSVGVSFNDTFRICRNLESEGILGNVRESSFPTYTYLIFPSFIIR